MKESYYFQHDYEPTSDPKIQALIGRYGAVGYGLYWRIVEMLHTEEKHFLPKKKYIFLALAQQMLTSVEQIEQIVNDCCNLFELFEYDESNFWSKRVFNNLEKRSNISEKRSLAGKKSAEMRKISTNVQQVSTHVQQNSTKERKEKEIKIKEKNISPSFEEIEIYFKENGFDSILAKRFFDSYSVANWHDSKGNPVKNWKQKAINVWFKDENKPKQVQQSQIPQRKPNYLN